MSAEQKERPPLQPLVSVDDLCTLWDVRRSWVYDEVASGRLKPRRIGRMLRFAESDLRDYLDRAEVRDK